MNGDLFLSALELEDQGQRTCPWQGPYCHVTPRWKGKRAHGQGRANPAVCWGRTPAAKAWVSHCLRVSPPATVVLVIEFLMLTNFWGHIQATASGKCQNIKCVTCKVWGLHPNHGTGQVPECRKGFTALGTPHGQTWERRWQKNLCRKNASVGLSSGSDPAFATTD